MFGAVTRERRAIEGLYEDICDVYGFIPVQAGAVTKLESDPLYEGVICGLSVATQSPASQSPAQADIELNVKLFLPPELDIPAGCSFVVHRFARVTNAVATECHYTASGVPMRYATHQEVLLLERRRA